MSEFFHEDARSRVFASPSSWIEGNAVRQVERASRLPGVTFVAGMPDLHPGHKGPVGCAVLSDGVLHPALIGTDVGCGMTLFVVDADRRRLRLDRIEKALRLMSDVDPDPDPSLLPEGVDAARADQLGSVGGGNHFAELQGIASCEDGVVPGLRAGGVALLVHSGSRALGTAVLERHARGEGGIEGEAAAAYLADHDRAVLYAAVNRRRIGERFLEAAGLCGTPLLDVPHNFVERVPGGFLHRKGAAPADRGVVPVAGSRGAPSRLVLPSGEDRGNLASIAHGAGRKRDRQASAERRRAKSADAVRRLDREDGRVVCADPKLRVEEAPDAYKDIRQVVADIERFGLGRPVAVLEPLVTFKRSGVRSDG